MDLETTFEKALAIRREVKQQGGELLPPERQGALNTEHRTVQVLRGEPVVIQFSHRNKDVTDTMRVIMSDQIAGLKEIQAIISPPAPAESRPDQVIPEFAALYPEY